ncbi:hypothetical protein [Photobacterium galatheae]|uniref:Uncharacterized protein n=1 Tax=Photobacterium galatheae TaxID=1654360 RepID=A0A066RJD6_9GAMM|nr:hypothetical protein [Photobacterium galatheae]KDM90449.1 hypothetical protein EA58_17130 [Photobacterium galatheae]MCM0147831.1 hypothetical protein [Photobacterium galatheae]
MNQQRPFVLMAALCTLAVPLTAHAAEQACVSLLVGAGYAAKMRIVSGSFSTDWTSSYPIGKTKCQSLSEVPIGNTYTVQVKAILGKTKDCTPSIKHSAGQGSITFQAWGTTLNVHCEMPTSDAAYQAELGFEPNAEGIKAKENLDQEVMN